MKLQEVKNEQPKIFRVGVAIDNIESAIQHLKEADYDYDVIDTLGNIAKQIGDEE